MKKKEPYEMILLKSDVEASREESLRNYILFVKEVYERIQREKLEKGSDTNPA